MATRAACRTERGEYVQAGPMIFQTFDDPTGPEPGLENRLRSLEQQAEIALPGFDAQFFNRAGDLCVETREEARALDYYGRAIDAYLRAGRFNAAGAVCRKLLRISPTSVRARCTLAWVSIGKGLLGETQREVDAYVEAAVAAAQVDLARRQIRMMAGATRNRELRALFADYLAKLGDPDAAGRIMSAEANAGDSEPAEALWSRVLRAALMGPDDLRGDL
jgi:tetratricopeptide (TPR) repeat protein